MGSKNRTVLIAEDERNINRLIADYLSSLGYQCLQAYDGAEAMKLFHREGADLAIVDVMMPGIDGIDLTRRIREQSTIPVIILTARAEEQDKLIGLDTGADDYMTKPFSLKELAARVRAQLRRLELDRPAGDRDEAQIFEYGGLRIEPESRRVLLDGKRIDPTSLQFDLLVALIRYPGKVFTRQALLDQIQQEAFEGYERTIDVHIKNIRKLIERDPKHPRLLQTVWGVGYKLETAEDKP